MMWMWLLLSTVFINEADTATHSGEPRGDLIIWVGSPGPEEYASLFREWTEKWIAAGEVGRFRVTAIGHQPEEEATLGKIAASLESVSEHEGPLWIVMIGHGTFDGRTAKFNLPGPDLDSQQLAEMLAPLKRPLAVINCTSASAPFMTSLAGPDRVIITATKVGAEVNFTRFGGYLAESITHPAADLDKDLQVSLLEAFLRASQLTLQYYEGDGQLPSEHAMLDDNGDARPVPATGFLGLEPVNREETPNLLPDGMLAHQWHLVPSFHEASLTPETLAQRDELEQQLAQLKQRKAEMSEEDYYRELEVLLVELARLLVTSEGENQTPLPTQTPGEPSKD